MPLQGQRKASEQIGPREGGSMQRLLSAHGVAVDATASKEPGQTDACRWENCATTLLAK